jgi:hypothetical protein
MSKIAELSLFFDQINECLVLGLKKKFLYEIKFVKEYSIKQNNTTTTNNNNNNTNNKKNIINKKDKDYLESTTVNNLISKNAIEKILTRFDRDLSGLLESHFIERKTKITELIENGSSNIQIIEAKQEYDEHFLESVKSELEKVLLTLCGVLLQKDLLQLKTTLQDKIKKQNSESDEESEDEEEDRLSRSRKQLMRKKSSLEQKFEKSTLDWFNEIVYDLISTYKTSPYALFYSFNHPDVNSFNVSFILFFMFLPSLVFI